MATPSRLREDVSDVADEAAEAFRDLTRGVPDSLVFDLVRDELPGLILVYGETAALLAAEFYDDARLAAGVAGAFSASPVDLPPVGADALLGWAAKTANTLPAMLTLVEGGARKRVTNGARLTVADNAARDPQAQGFQRYARSSGGCGFCQMLAGRGFVYRSADTADFGAHDSCKCVAVPSFTGAPLPVKPYKPTGRNITDADRARTRAWVASH